LDKRTWNNGSDNIWKVDLSLGSTRKSGNPLTYMTGVDR